MSKTQKAPHTIFVKSGIKSLIEKVELDWENNEIRIFFKKTLRRYGRRYFERNLALWFKREELEAPTISPLFSKLKKDTSQDPFHKLTEDWEGLVVIPGLTIVWPLWKQYDNCVSAFPPHPVKSFNYASEELLTSIVTKWKGSSDP